MANSLPGARTSKRKSCSDPDSVKQSRPSGPNARSFGPYSGCPATSENSSSTVPSRQTRWMPDTALVSPLPGTLPPWVT